MLVVSLTLCDQVAIIGPDGVRLVVRLTSIRGGKVRVGVDAPLTFNIQRENAAGESLCKAGPAAALLQEGRV